MNTNDELLSTQEVARMLGISDRSVLNYAKRGELVGEPRMRGKQQLWQFRRSVVEAYQQQQQTQTGPSQA